MKKLTTILAEYNAYHTKQATLFSHLIGVPLVVFATMIFFSWITIGVKPFFTIPVVWLLLVAVGIYYLRLDLRIGGAVLVVMCVMAAIACWLTQDGVTQGSGITFLICFVGGWVAQLIGHVFEGKRPALTDNILQVFTAPMFLAVEIAKLCGLHREDLF